MTLVRKYDNYLESNQPKAAENAWIGGFMGLIVLFGGLSILVSKGFNSSGLLTLLMGCTMLFISTAEFYRYRRSLSKKSPEEKTEPRSKGDLSIYQPDSLPAKKAAEALSAKTTDELSTSNLSHRVAPPSAVEHTTQHLDAAIRQEGKTHSED